MFGAELAEFVLFVFLESREGNAGFFGIEDVFQVWAVEPIHPGLDSVEFKSADGGGGLRSA